MNQKLMTITASHLAIGLFGFYLAPREMLDTQIKQTGLFTVDTRKVLSAAVTSLQAESKLLVYSYKGGTTVSVSRKMFFNLLNGRQELIIPAGVTYYLNMSKLDLEDVSFDERSKIVTVQLPALELGDVSFQPEAARTINGGLLTFSQAQVDELSRINYSTARRSFTKQAQGRMLVDLAKQQAKRNIAAYFEIPLRIVGHPDVRVVSIFKGD